MVICKRNYEESCDCRACERERERRRVAADGPLSVTEHEED